MGGQHRRKVGLILRALALLRATLSAKFIEFSNVSKYSFHPILLLCMIFASIHTRSTSGRSPTIFQNPHSLSYLLASSIRFPTPAAGERATEDAFDEFLESNAIHAKSPNRVGRDATNDGPDGTAVDIFKTFEISENQDLEDCHYCRRRGCVSPGRPRRRSKEHARVARGQLEKSGRESVSVADVKRQESNS